jgi:hypothetical protein
MLEGEISQINLIERLVELWREQFTGAIRFENDGIIKIVYCKGGDILSASTNDRSDSIDEILMRAGKVSREHVKQALAKRKESETLGDALLNLGFITRKELTWARRVQVVGVIRSIAAWTEGSFTIVADYLPKRDEGTLFPLPQVLVELIVTDQDRARFERALDGGEVVFTRTADFDDVWRRLGLNEDAEAIAVEIDGVKSATAVATASGRDTFNVYKLLHALATLGVLRPAAAQQFALDDFASAGVADAADVWNNDAQPELTDADFAPEPEPAFQLDEPEPTVEQELPLDTNVPPTPSAWDEADEVPLDLSLDSTTPTPKMPVWNTPAPPPISHIDEEPQWGFDEAQIETSRASMPAADAIGAPIPVKKERGGRYGVLVALMVIAILAAAGYFGFVWWQGTQDAAATKAIAARTTPPPAPRPAPVNPTTTTTAEPTANDTATSSVATTSAPPVTATTASVEPSPTQALPRVTARAAATGAGRDRLDTMAREYASNPQGNFTVQIQILCDWSNLEKLVRSSGDNVWFVPQTIGERACYRVFWGHYETRAQAQQALAQIPASARDANSAVKAVPRG